MYIHTLKYSAEYVRVHVHILYSTVLHMYAYMYTYSTVQCSTADHVHVTVCIVLLYCTAVVHGHCVVQMLMVVVDIATLQPY